MYSPSPLGESGALAIVQYETQPLDSYRHRVEAAGGKVGSPLPSRQFLSTVTFMPCSQVLPDT